MTKSDSLLQAPCVHGFWQVRERTVSSGLFHLWIELPKSRARSIHSPRKKEVPVHPFSAGHAVLPDYFTEQKEILSEASYKNIVVKLPAKNQQVRFESWQVDTLSLEAGDVFDFLTRDSFKVFELSDSLACFREAALWTLTMLARGAFNPDLRRLNYSDSVSLSAFWRLKFSEEEERRLETFAAAMPAEIRFNIPREMKAAVFLRHFMETCADSWIRRKAGLEKETFFAALPQQWLKSLTTPLENAKTCLVSGPRAELEQFEKDLQAWLGFEQDKKFRVCFKLVEPDHHDEQWCLDFALQSLEDRSVLIPAASIWARDAEASALLTREGVPRPDEFLLAGLSRAAVLFAPIAAALTVRAPSRAVLSGREAYFFLTQQALLFKARGLGVLVPEWWHQKKKRVTLRLRLKPPGKISLKDPGLPFSQEQSGGLQSYLDYDWDVLLGDQAMEMEAFENLARLKTPFLKINGEWVELRLQEIDNLIRYFDCPADKRSAKRISVGDALRLALESDNSECGLAVSDICGEGWVEGWLKQLSGSLEITPVEVPKSFVGKLRAYQKRGLSWLAFLSNWGLGACLADDMGLGKTIQLIALMLHKKERGELRGPLLLVCPMSIVGNWKRELAKFAPSLKVWIHHGDKRLSSEDFRKAASAADVVITTYSLVYRDQESLALADWEMLVLDEAQNIKNEEALQTRAVKTFKARIKIALTGTPVENRLTELWSLMDFLNPGYLGAFEYFRTRFQNPIEKRLDPERLNILKRRVAPFVLRRLKTDRSIIRDLPEKMEMKVYCSLTLEQASLYQSVAEEMLAKIREASGIQRKGLVFSAITKLKQVCNHPVHYHKDESELSERSGKLNRLEEMLEEILEEGGNSLVFTQYVEMGHLLVRAIADRLGKSVLFLHGGLSLETREKIVSDFQNKPDKFPVLILSVKAGGSGLNLTAANHVFHYDRWWNPAVEDQATDRAYRIGQVRNVQVHKFLCAGTLEEKIDLLMERKKVIAEAVITSGEDFLTEISDEELREVLTLDADSAAE